MDFIPDDLQQQTVAEMIADSVIRHRFTNPTCDPTPVERTSLSWWIDWFYDADYQHSTLVRVFQGTTNRSVQHLWLCWPGSGPLQHVWDGDPHPFFEQHPTRSLHTSRRFLTWTYHTLYGSRLDATVDGPTTP